MANELTWHDVLAEEKQQPYFSIPFRPSPASGSPRHYLSTTKDVFNAFRFTELGDVKVVILSGILITDGTGAWSSIFRSRHCDTPSLLNMYKELENTIPGFTA